MPSNTFFRLPEEKRQRLLTAARKEFKRIRFSDVSINRIILNACIPRGSFYQYFEDKEDLFRYLMGDMRDYFYHALVQLLEAGKGNLFSVPVGAFDLLVAGDGMDPVLSECVDIIQANPGMDMSWLFDDRVLLVPEEIYEKIDRSNLRKPDHSFVCHVFYLLLVPLAFAIAETLHHPERREQQRSLLVERIEIIQQGAQRTQPQAGREEDTIC